MFTNLVESNSHAREFKRRGSFFLFTTVTYLLMFAIGGLASIYAYDARLADQNTEELVLLSPIDFPRPAPEQPRNVVQPAAGARRNSASVPERQVNMASVNVPQAVPKGTSAQPNLVKPVPDRGDYVIGRYDADPIGPPAGGNSIPINPSLPSHEIEVGTPPPAMPTPEKPKPQIIRKSVINGQATFLPKPPYPPMARQIRIQGTVNVQVLVDETGKVVSAKAVSGHPLLVVAAQQAAMQARFSPTYLGDQAMKVSGVITYNFMLDH